MRASWECLFRVFDERLNLLLKVWRQHRLELASHVETYAGGLFEQWYHFVRINLLRTLWKLNLLRFVIRGPL